MDSIRIDGKSLQTLAGELREAHNVVGLTLGVLKDGVIETAGAGLLNKATGVECTADSAFQIGSITKIFTTTLIMQLVEAGRLSLDDPVIKHLPDFALADLAAARAVTVRQLLNHTSGIEGDFFPADDPEGPSVGGYVRKMCLLPSLYPPGQGPVSYCNSGFVLAGRLIEVLTGLTWQSAVMERICKPLGMPVAFAHPHEALRFRAAMGHMPDPKDDKSMIAAPITYLPISMAPAGSVLMMSAESLLLFAKAHLNDGAYGNGQRLLSAESARAMREPATKLPAFSPLMSHIGLGWFVADRPGYRMVAHTGGTIGQSTLLAAYPEHKVAYALFVNSPSGKLFEEADKLLLKSLPGHEVPAPLARESFTPKLERYLGHYSAIMFDCHIALKDDKLTFKLKGKSPLVQDQEATLEPFSPDVFEMKNDKLPPDGPKALFVGDDAEGRAQFICLGSRLARRVVV